MPAATAAKGYGDLDTNPEDKENSAPRPAGGGDSDPEDEEIGDAPTPRHHHQAVLDSIPADGAEVDGDDGQQSDTEALRRSSLGTTVITESNVGDPEDSEGEEVHDGGGYGSDQDPADDDLSLDETGPNEVAAGDEAVVCES
jgi:hypothetical protein